MKTYYITFRSITWAQQGERLLQRAGNRCTLLRTPRWMEERGCGYCLRIRTESPAPVLNRLRQQGLPFRKVYILSGDGVLEELEL